MAEANRQVRQSIEPEGAEVINFPTRELAMKGITTTAVGHSLGRWPAEPHLGRARWRYHDQFFPKEGIGKGPVLPSNHPDEAYEDVGFGD